MGFVGLNIRTQPVQALGFVGQNSQYSSYLIIKLKLEEGSSGTLANLPIEITGSFTTINLISDVNGYALIPNREFDRADITVELDEFNAAATYDATVQTNQYIEVELVSTTEKYKILTTQPRKRMVSHDQKIMYLDTLFYEAVSTIKYEIVYTDNSSTVRTESQDFAQGLVYRHRVDFDALKNIDPSKTVKYIKVFYADNQQSVLFFFQQARQTRPMTIIYRNSLGGYDTLHCEGYTKKAIQTSAIATYQSLPAAFGPTFRQKDHVGQLSMMQYSLNTGYKSSDEIQALADLFHNNEAYLIEQTSATDKLIPLTLNLGTTPLIDQQSNLQAISFTATEAIEKPYYD